MAEYSWLIAFCEIIDFQHQERRNSGPPNFKDQSLNNFVDVPLFFVENLAVSCGCRTRVIVAHLPCAVQN